MVQKSLLLNGKTIVVTRPREQAAETVRAIEAMGGKAYLLPTIEIQAPHDTSAARTFFQTLANSKVDYVILMSANGVQHLLSIAEDLGVGQAVKKNLRKTVVMAVGPRTAKELEANGIHVDLIPEKYTSEGILQCLRQRHAKGKMIYIPRTSEAPPELGESLRAMGNHVEDIYVYQSGLPKDNSQATSFVTDLVDCKIDAILFTSALGVRNFFEMLKNVITEKELKELIAKGTTIVAIGPTTAKPLAEAHINVDVMPRNHTLNEALDALASFWKARE